MSTSVCCCWQRIPQSYVGIVENLGKFEQVLPPGCSYLGCISEVRGLLSLRLQRVHVVVSSNTKERVGVFLGIDVMYRAIPSEAPTAFYSTTGIKGLLQTMAEASMRAEVPNFTVDELFTLRDELSKRTKVAIGPQLQRYGFEVAECLLTDVRLPQDVSQAIQNQVEQKYARAAADARGDIERLKRTIDAEGRAEAQRLSGVGAAYQQGAVMGSLGDLITRFKEGEQSDEMMATILMQQYFDAIDSISKAKNTHTIFAPGQALKHFAALR